MFGESDRVSKKFRYRGETCRSHMSSLYLVGVLLGWVSGRCVRVWVAGRQGGIDFGLLLDLCYPIRPL